ncbi:MAG: hypothetical protein EOO28_25125 [Comamonadaceae bacterium]|nr:MAG: hypothetical protein EOO28_25125 [Comamonadaceae bacterium]
MRDFHETLQPVLDIGFNRPVTPDQKYKKGRWLSRSGLSQLAVQLAEEQQATSKKKLQPLQAVELALPGHRRAAP